MEFKTKALQRQYEIAIQTKEENKKLRVFIKDRIRLQLLIKNFKQKEVTKKLKSIKHQ